MKIRNSFIGRTALAVMLVSGLAISGCKKAPAPDNGSGNNNPGGTGTEETVDYTRVLSMKVENVSMTSAVFKGTLKNMEVIIDLEDGGEIGVSYSKGQTYSKEEETDGAIKVTRVKVDLSTIYSDGSFTIPVTELEQGQTYYFSAYIQKNGKYYFSSEDEQSFETLKDDPYIKQTELDMASATDLSKDESANCYVITRDDSNNNNIFKFLLVKGNDKTQVLESPNAAEILWESTGTDIIPEFCSIISGVCIGDNYLGFKIPASFKQGNAVVAVKNAEGKILWSWHIWVVEKLSEQEYPNGAGIMMDRNLGAVSSKGIGDCGLLYQWGRKDPFLGYSSASGSQPASSTIDWPIPVWANSDRGTIEWATEHPTTFIAQASEEVHGEKYTFTQNNETYVRDTYYSGNNDWIYNDKMATPQEYYTNKAQKIIKTDRWGSSKTIFDPCPSGWRVPDGGDNSVWNKAGFTSNNCSGDSGVLIFTNGSVQICYPAAGWRSNRDGGLLHGGSKGYYWSANAAGTDDVAVRTYKLNFDFGYLADSGTAGGAGAFNTKGDYYPGAAVSVRCFKIQ